MTLDAIAGKLLEGGRVYVVVAALLYFMFKPPKWFQAIINSWIENSKTRAASFERLLTAIHALEQTLMLQLQVHERAAADHLLRDQERHEKLMMQIEKVGHTDRHEERNKMQHALANVTADVQEARDYICERIDESMEKAIARAMTPDLKGS